MRSGVDADRWQQVDDLFHAAAACAGPERERILHQGCGDDHTLRREVESLLVAHEQSSDFIDFPAFDISPRAVTSDVDSAFSGQRIGRYTLVRVLGAGGMGVVWEARQERPHRAVALKVIRPGLLAGNAFRRFEHEAEVLARLQHPGIAQIYEAGTHATETGSVAYFAMELVRGEPLTIYSNVTGLDTAAKLRLFIGVCEAVEYAHQKGVIHRDLKPGNILVVDDCGMRNSECGMKNSDRTGTQTTIHIPHSAIPKILDFGVARTIDSDVQLTTLHTEVGQIMGTIPYMSPEQVGGRSDAIDTRSDVYTLGVVLYELLTGRLPHDLTGKLLPEAARMIREDAPARPSSIRPHLRGDLETLVGKAMEKEPSRRYASVSQFASDIQHYLHNEPISARPASVFYQFRKLALRHKLPFGIATAAFAVLTVLAVWMSVLYAQARAAGQLARLEGERATQKAATADRVKEFLLQVFEAHDPNEAKGKEVSAAELLERGIERMETELTDEPLIRAELLHTMGEVLLARGRFERGAKVLGSAYEARLEELGETDPATLESMVALAGAYADLHRFPESEDLYRRALGLARQHQPEEVAAIATILADMAMVVRTHDLEEAESLHREALSLRRQVLGAQHPDVGESLTSLGVVVRNLGRLVEAEGCYREALAIWLPQFGDDRITVGHAYNSLGVTLKLQGRWAEAEDAYLHAQRIYRRLLGDVHPLLANNLRSVAQLQRSQGKFAEAERLMREALAMNRALVGDVHGDVASSLDVLGGLVGFELEDPAAAEPLKREALEIYRQIYPAVNAGVAHGCLELGMCLQELGRHEEAYELFSEARAVHLELNGRESRECAKTGFELGRSLASLGRFEESRERLLDALDTFRELKDSGSIVQVEHALGQCMLKWNDMAGAEEWLLSAAEHFGELSPPKEADSETSVVGYHRLRRQIMQSLSDYYDRQGQPAEAKAWRDRLSSVHANPGEQPATAPTLNR